MKSIEWTDITINCVVGCSKGCPYCYAKSMNDRFKFIEDFSKPQKFLHRLDKINKIKNKRIFMNSMSDFFYWDSETIRAVNKAIRNNPSNEYYFLTKEPLIYLSKLHIRYSKNVYLGITVTNSKSFSEALYCLAYFRVLNIEPLLENIENFECKFLSKWTDTYNLSKVIIGAETGNRKDKVIPKKEWIERIINACEKANVTYFLKENIKKYL